MEDFCGVLKRRGWWLGKVVVEKESELKKKKKENAVDLKVERSLAENEGILALIRSAINHFPRKRRPPVTRSFSISWKLPSDSGLPGKSFCIRVASLLSSSFMQLDIEPNLASSRYHVNSIFYLRDLRGCNYWNISVRWFVSDRCADDNKGE